VTYRDAVHNPAWWQRPLAGASPPYWCPRVVILLFAAVAVGWVAPTTALLGWSGRPELWEREPLSGGRHQLAGRWRSYQALLH